MSTHTLSHSENHSNFVQITNALTFYLVTFIIVLVWTIIISTLFSSKVMFTDLINSSMSFHWHPEHTLFMSTFRTSTHKQQPPIRYLIRKKQKVVIRVQKKNSFLNNRSLSLSFTKKYEEWKSHYFVCILIIRGMESTSFQCGFLQPLNSLPIRVIGAIVPDVGRFYFLYIQILLLFFAFWNWVHFTFPYKIFSFQTSTPSQSQLQLQTSSFTITDSVCLFNQPRVNSFVLLYSIHRISLCSFVQWYGRTCQSILFHRSCEFWRIKTTQQSLTQYHRSQHSSPLSGLSYNWIWTIQYTDSQFVYKTKRHGNLLKSLLIFLIFSCN